MDVQKQTSDCPCCQELYHGFSFERCCLLLLFFLLFIAAMVGAATFTIIFILRPKKPIFTLQTVRLDSLKLDTSSSSNIYVSSVVSLTLNVQNPNKVGLSYSPSLLKILYKGIPIGVIEVPQFYQPAHSKNLSVHTQVVLEHVSISPITVAVLLKDSSKKSLVKMSILGDIRAGIHVLSITLPKIKVALDCEISLDCRKFIFRNGLYSMGEDHRVSQFTNSPSFSKKCSLAIYI